MSSADMLDAQKNDHELSMKNAAKVGEYHLSAGDKLRIQVFGEDDLKLDTLIAEEGKISYPFLGEINVKGLTIHDLESLITQGLKGAYLINPEVNISILQYRLFFINGEVNKSGGYPYQPNLTFRKAIALAGGLTEQASLELATIIQESDAAKVSQPIGLKFVISPGDIITILAYKQVFINGEVRNPGAYSFQQGLTLHRVISLAGGFTERAAQDKIIVIHEGNLSEDTIEASLEDAVSPGDIITVKQSFF
ncbi:MAG: SLBB domain-containing protein [Proteobacteria bacterium]|nr:SLBB domain-containing protein [Pseudomonadota bacterium]